MARPIKFLERKIINRPIDKVTDLTDPYKLMMQPSKRRKKKK